MVAFKTSADANEFVIDNIIAKIEENWVSYIPDHAVYQVGVVYNIHEGLETEEILKELDAISIKTVKKVVRCIKRVEEEDIQDDQDEWISTESIKIYCVNELPKNILIYNVPRKVFRYVFPIRRCYNCQRFGHNYNACRHSIRCVKCGEQHKYVTCKAKTYKCGNCFETHMASDESCIFYKFNRAINETRAKLNVNIIEAIDFLKLSYSTEFFSENIPSHILLAKSLETNDLDTEVIDQSIILNENTRDDLAVNDEIRRTSIEIVTKVIENFSDALLKAGENKLLQKFNKHKETLSNLVISEFMEEDEADIEMSEKEKNSDPVLSQQ